MTHPVSSTGAVVNAMTVDVEDYFHASAFDSVVSRAAWDGIDSRVVPNTMRLLEMFDRRGVRATFFVLGWIADRFPGLVRQISLLGHEVASHGYHHQLLYMLTPNQFREDIRSAKAAIESVTGKAVLGFRAPSYSIIQSNLWTLDVLLEEGHLYDASIFPIHHDRYGIPDGPRHPYVMRRAGGPLVEMPGSTVRVGTVNLPIAGGGYFRLLPYGWTRWGMERVNRVEGKPVVFYIHPWEIDPDQPRFAVGAFRRWRHYTGLGRTTGRLDQLLSEFKFECASHVLGLPEGAAGAAA
jgi:polysaccharide deacetylase family protein (PEP-CTERM system associated)